MKYRKKPVVIEAFYLKDLSQKTIIEALQFMGQNVEMPRGYPEHDNPFEDYIHMAWKDNGIKISTLEGTMLASEGDYIIRGIKGEYYPCKPDIFEQTYKPVEQCTRNTTPTKLYTPTVGELLEALQQYEPTDKIWFNTPKNQYTPIERVDGGSYQMTIVDGSYANTVYIDFDDRFLRSWW